MDNLTAQEVIQPRFWDDYQRAKRVLWEDIVLLHSNIHILDRMHRFPTVLFGASRAVFQTLMVNCFQNSIGICCRIAADSNADSFTLNHFANKLPDWAREEFKLQMHERIRGSRLDSSAREILKRMKMVRNKFLAHHDSETLFDPNSKVLPVTGTDIESVADKVGTRFKHLAMNEDFMFTPIEFYEANGMQPQYFGNSEMDDLLHRMAMNSRVIRTILENTESWRALRPRLSPELIGWINATLHRAGHTPIE